MEVFFLFLEAILSIYSENAESIVPKCTLEIWGKLLSYLISGNLATEYGLFPVKFK